MLSARGVYASLVRSVVAVSSLSYPADDGELKATLGASTPALFAPVLAAAGRRVCYKQTAHFCWTWVRVMMTFLSATMLLSSVSIKVVDAVSGRKKETELEQS